MLHSNHGLLYRVGHALTEVFHQSKRNKQVKNLQVLLIKISIIFVKAKLYSSAR